MSKTAFERYAPFIQAYIYRKNWADLREVQVEACDAIMDTDQHVIIASGTASGKTEAAFFPMLTLLEEKPSTSVGILYIGPLKALINDQFERLSALLDDSDIPVWPWHGDVAQSVKQRALRQGRGVLQITPESLEAMLMQHSGDAVKLFRDLRFVVIDEIHALMGTDRGLQTLCLLTRLERATNCMPRRIGLSATLHEYDTAQAWLAAGTDRQATVTGIQVHKRSIALHVESFLLPKDEQQAAETMRVYNEFLYNACHTQKCILFSNSRGKAEAVIADLKELAQRRKEADVFYVHHGSVSADLRHDAESALRESKGPVVAAATLTLELGIDIGDLDATFQLGAPFSCISFVQRLGRSGRRTGKSQMMFVTLADRMEERPMDAIPWELLQTIAVIQLYLEERWVEPSVQKPKPFSVLAHQTLSKLMTYGELLPATLAARVLTLPAFQGSITTEEYQLLLRHMLEEDILERMDNGGIIIGLKGAKVTSHYSFYSVFQNEETWHVIHQEHEVGTLDSCPAAQEAFILAGRAWQVLTIDEERQMIYVKPIKNRRIPSWHGRGGDIHERIAQRMRHVLMEDTMYPYLGQQAVQHLAEAREITRQAGILKHQLTVSTDGNYILCPWRGSKIIRTIHCLLSGLLKESFGIGRVYASPYYLQFSSTLAPEAFSELAKALQLSEDDAQKTLSPEKKPTIDKYDWMLSDTLLQSAYVANQLDISGAVAVLHGIADT